MEGKDEGPAASLQHQEPHRVYNWKIVRFLLDHSLERMVQLPFAAPVP